MSRPKMLPGTRPAKEMLSTRIPSYVYDRLRAYAISSRLSIEEITTEALTRLIDAEAPTLANKHPAPAPEPAAAGGVDDARIDRLEKMLETLLRQQTAPTPVAHPAPARAGRKA